MSDGAHRLGPLVHEGHVAQAGRAPGLPPVPLVQAGEAWDLWSVEDGRRIGFLSVVDDGHVVYALSTVKRGTSHEEVADLVEGFFTPSSTDAHNREIIISDYDEEPEMLESDIRQA